MQQHVNPGTIDLAHVRKIKHDARPVFSEDWSDFAQQSLDLSHLYLLRHLLHDYGVLA
jgi:hypothetical protein